MKREKLSPWVRFFHIIVLIFFWGLYGAGLFFISVAPEDFYDGLIFMLIIEVLIWLIFVVLWVRRHLFLHRTLKPRKAIPSKDWHYEKDLIGYDVVFEVTSPKEEQVIIIDCNTHLKTKYYRSIKKVQS